MKFNENRNVTVIDDFFQFEITFKSKRISYEIDSIINGTIKYYMNLCV